MGALYLLDGPYYDGFVGALNGKFLKNGPKYIHFRIPILFSQICINIEGEINIASKAY
ncbi:MAG: hypothetical protein U0T81_18995 [Saprospiraceae bacterium]